MRKLMLLTVVLISVCGVANAADQTKSAATAPAAATTQAATSTSSQTAPQTGSQTTPVAAPVSAARVAAAEQVRAAETAFAKAFADHDVDRFVAMLDDHATFLSGSGTLHGKADVTRVWSKMVAQPKAPFSWKPERVEVSGDGTIGFSSGPVRDAQGRQFAVYTSVWQRQGDGSWKVIFDGPGCAVAPEE
jgi:ketosteroid isomerase-like protein